MSTVGTYTKAELVALIKENLPPQQVAQWEGEDGEEIYEAIAAAFALVSQRSTEVTDGALILRATGPVRATTTITVTLLNAPTGTLEILEGQVICKTAWGVTYRLTADLSIANPATSATGVAVEAVWPSHEANLPAATIDEWALPSGVNRQTLIAWGAGTSAADQAAFLSEVDAGTATVLADADATGGRLATLDLIGSERGLPREAGEEDPSYRQRIRAIPDAVTPAGILRRVNAVLQTYGVTATLHEPWDFGWTVGHATNGAIGVSPITRPLHFVIQVPDVGAFDSGWAVGNATDGVIGQDPIGVGDETHAGIIDGLQALVDRIAAAGVWGLVVEVT